MSAQPRPGFRDDRIEALRIPPHSVDAEQNVLGSLLLDPRCVGRVTLDPDEFYRRDHRLVYEAIQAMDAAGKPFDVVTLGEWFEREGRDGQIGGSAYLIELASMQGSAANVEAYADIVREKAKQRRLIEIGTELVNAGFTQSEPDAAADQSVRELMALARDGQRCEFTIQQAAKMAWDDAQVAYELEGKLRGITTGYIDLDRRLGGWHKQDLIFLAARPSMGKTALAVNMSLRAAEAGHSVGLVSGEQGALQIGQRSVAVEANVAAERMRNGGFEDEDWPRLNMAMRKLAQRKLRLYDRSAPTLDEVCRTARRWKQEHGIAVLFVDYLQRIRFPKAENRIEEVSEVARGLKSLARNLDIPVVALAQVKGEVDKRPDKRPNLGDIANSDEATREADLIAFLYRDEVYNDNADNRGLAELNVEKNRHGPTGQFVLTFHGETMQFENLAKEPHVYTSGRDRAAGES